MGVSNEHVAGVPHPRLRPFVSVYTGYRTAGGEPGVHAGLPSGTLTFIVAFDDRLDVTDGHGGGRDQYWGMLAGLHSRPALVRHEGRQHGVQLAVTPRGASALFGVPAGSLGGTVSHLDDVVPEFAAELIERLAEARSWRARWAALDGVLLRFLRDELRVAPQLDEAWAALVATHGAVGIGELADQVGWSRRHLGQQFRRHFGLTPKTLARVLRFERAQQMLRLPTQPSLASVAHVCGYADQAHMTREWNEFAGSPPTTWMVDESIPFVQDAGAHDPSG